MSEVEVMKEKLSFSELAELVEGTRLFDGHKEGVRTIILRGPASLCAYLGVPLDHPLADKSCDDIPLDCHGGLTFGSKGKGDYLPDDYFWYGWDYSHCDDRSFYDIKSAPEARCRGREWDLKMVLNDIWRATFDFKRLMKLTEGEK